MTKTNGVTLADLHARRDELLEQRDAEVAREEPLTCQFPLGDGECGDDGTIFEVVHWLTGPGAGQPPINVCTLHVGAAMGARLDDAPRPAYRVWLMQETV